MIDLPDTPQSTPASFLFDGQPVTIIEIEGKPYFIAKEIGAVLGYAQDGRALGRQFSNEWSDRMRCGHHYHLAEGDALARLKDLVGNAYQVDPRSPSLLLLTEPGIYRVLMLSGKPTALKFQDWLDSEVLPTLRKTGTYSVPGASARPVNLPKASALPKALLGVPGGVLLELLNAEHAMGGPLESLRVALIDAAEGQQVAHRLARSRNGVDEQVEALEAENLEMHSRNELLREEIAASEKKFAQFGMWYAIFSSSYRRELPEAAARQAAADKVALDAERQRADLWLEMRKADRVLEYQRQTQVYERLKRLMAWYRETHGTMRSVTLGSFLNAVRLHPTVQRVRDLALVCYEHSTELQESWIAELEQLLGYPLEQDGGAS